MQMCLGCQLSAQPGFVYSGQFVHSKQTQTMFLSIFNDLFSSLFHTLSLIYSLSLTHTSGCSGQIFMSRRSCCVIVLDTASGGFYCARFGWFSAAALRYKTLQIITLAGFSGAAAPIWRLWGSTQTFVHICLGQRCVQFIHQIQEQCSSRLLTFWLLMLHRKHRRWLDEEQEVCKQTARLSGGGGLVALHHAERLMQQWHTDVFSAQFWCWNFKTWF